MSKMTETPVLTERMKLQGNYIDFCIECKKDTIFRPLYPNKQINDLYICCECGSD